MSARVAVVIITYQSATEIDGCLAAVQRHAPAGTETVVVDNASDDDTCERVRRHTAVRLIANRVNRGFGAACNQGAAATTAPVILLLNPDAQLAGSLEPLLTAAEQYGAAGGALVNPDGTPQHGFALRQLPTAATLACEVLGINRLWPGNPANRRYRMLDANPAQPQFIGQPAGAFLAVSRTAWLRVGGMDEGFTPVWFEDVDLCQRLAANGIAIWYEPGSAAVHTGAHSVGMLPAGARARAWYGNLLRYAGLHFQAVAVRMVALAVMAGVSVRLLTVREPLHVWWDVMKLAGGRLWSAATLPAPGGQPVTRKAAQ